MYPLLVFVLCYTCVSSHVFHSPLDSLQYDNAVVAIDDSIKITASPDTLNTSGDWTTVTWSGVDKPDSHDWIGVYTQPMDGSNTIDPSKQAPVKYQYCKYSLDHLSKGEGSFKFYMVNLRVPYLFAFLRHDFSNPTLSAVSNPVRFINPNEPLQGHLMLTEDPTQIKLMWVTRDSDNPEMRFSIAQSAAIMKVKATSMTYKSSDMCGSPATDVGFIDPGQLHTAIFKDLHPGKLIYYSFGDDKYGWSKMYNFTVPPSPNATSTTRIIAYGDMGQGQKDDGLQPLYINSQLPSLNTTRYVLRDLDSVDLVLHIGDLSYAIGYSAIWDEFFDQIQPIATHVPYMVSVGNHERDFPNSGSYYTGTDSGGECGIPYGLRFPMPRPAPDQDWYTFQVGSVQVVLMSTEHNFTIGSIQYNWINETLARIDRDKTPWVIFSGHRPMYVDSTNDNGNASDISVANELMQYIEPLLMKYKVNLGIWGHHHSYQKTCPVYQGKCTSGAPVHVVIGMAGQGLSNNIKYGNRRPNKPDWVEMYDVEHYGYSRITTNETSLLFEYVRDDDGQVHDTLLLQRQTTN